jgi:hypothetical protein
VSTDAARLAELERQVADQARLVVDLRQVVCMLMGELAAVEVVALNAAAEACAAPLPRRLLLGHLERVFAGLLASQAGPEYLEAFEDVETMTREAIEAQARSAGDRRSRRSTAAGSAAT